MAEVTEPAEKDVNLYNAKLAEQAERYDDMVGYMDKVVKDATIELSVEERNLLSVAFKNVVGCRRASWRILSTIESKSSEEDRKNDSLLKSYKTEIEQELKNYCNDLLSLIETHLIPNCTTPEGQVFYLKMKGDYKRYLAEFQSGHERKEAAEESLKAYKNATDVAISDLPTTHPVRLGLALNYSVFYYEILNSPDKACTLAKAAFDDAIADLEAIDQESYKDSTLILQLLRDNLTLWTSDMKYDPNADQGEKLEDVE